MNPFTKHPHAMGESYWKHLAHSLLFSFRMLVAGVVCLIHGLFPFLFVFTTSNILARMTATFLKRKPDDRRFEHISDL